MCLLLAAFVLPRWRKVTCLLDVFVKEEFEQSRLMLFAAS
jgi:hypothetical protein